MTVRRVLALVALTALASPKARADEGKAGLAFIAFMFGVLVPSEFGVDAAVTTGGRRFRLGWAYQVPLGIFTTDDWTDGSLPLMRHRIVLSAHFLFGDEVDPDNPLDFRFGYRYRALHHSWLTPYAGLGITFGPDGVALSPELGLHLGCDRSPRPGVQLGVQADAYFGGAPLRLMALAGWTVW